MADVIDKDLYVFGNRSGPSPPRIDRDVFPDAENMLEPEIGPPWNGKSAFADLKEIPLTGHYHRLPAGTILPAGLGVVADGQDADTESVQPPTHHTIYPTRRMSAEEFTNLFLGLSWQYEGKR